MYGEDPAAISDTFLHSPPWICAKSVLVRPLWSSFAIAPSSATIEGDFSVPVTAGCELSFPPYSLLTLSPSAMTVTNAQAPPWNSSTPRTVPLQSTTGVALSGATSLHASHSLMISGPLYLFFNCIELCNFSVSNHLSTYELSLSPPT